ncbi:MAG: ATP-binding cassette domain-containing protein [Erysipelotrichaceae bacterium]|nr:ATP-binding cassette domain-containing protein [Erysipelotrichaceae bacterium]MDD4643145.1 ATP-binding cassette domain-containing protein [Erysipelotrichaceae bacterium]
MLEVKELSKYYGKHKGIENLSFTLDESEIIGIIGANGSGKTTTFRLLLGLLMADSGTITYDGVDINLYDNRLFGYLPEDRSVYRDLKVEEQLRFLARLKKLPEEQIENNIDHWLERLNIQQYRYRLIKELSKGNQQKVQLICALIHDPKVIIFDEPLTGLDISNVLIIKKLINQLQKDKKLIMISSHQYEYIEEFCEKIILLDKGDVKYSGKVNELKKFSDNCYISMNIESKRNFEDEDGVILQEESGNMIRILMVNQSKAKKLMRKILKDEKVFSLKIESLTIKDMIAQGNIV